MMDPQQVAMNLYERGLRLNYHALSMKSPDEQCTETAADRHHTSRSQTVMMTVPHHPSIMPICSARATSTTTKKKGSEHEQTMFFFTLFGAEKTT